MSPAWAPAAFGRPSLQPRHWEQARCSPPGFVWGPRGTPSPAGRSVCVPHSPSGTRHGRRVSAPGSCSRAERTPALGLLDRPGLGFPLCPMGRGDCLPPSQSCGGRGVSGHSRPRSHRLAYSPRPRHPQAPLARPSLQPPVGPSPEAPWQPGEAGAAPRRGVRAEPLSGCRRPPGRHRWAGLHGLPGRTTSSLDGEWAGDG